MKMAFAFLLLFSLNLFAQSSGNYCSTGKIDFYSKLKKIDYVEYPGDQNIDVTYYKLDLEIDYDTKHLSGEVTVKAKSLINDLQSFYLDLQDHFTIESVTLNNTTLNTTLQNDKLEITLNQPYQINEEFEVVVKYNGTPGSSGFGSFEFSDHNGSPAIWTLSEPYGASDWFPCKDTPADKVDSSDVWITADNFFVSVSNGTLEEEIDNGNGTKTYKWKNRYPIAQYLISLAMTNYQVYQNDFEYTPGKYLPVVHYNYPENFDSTRKSDLDKTNGMLNIFSNLFGPYPFLEEKYGHAEFGWGGGMEHQTISSMGYFGEGVVAHELAHQWFGDKITCANWQNIWLNEGFASYSEALYVENKVNETEYNSKINYFMNIARNAIGSIYVSDISSVGSIFNYERSYAKGAVVLHMLRKVLGNEIFFTTLKQYLSNPDLAYNVATTEDFQAVCEEVSGIDLEYFFSEWIYGENYPRYSYTWSNSYLGNGKFKIYLNVSQSMNTNPKYFTMPIDVKITTVTGDTTINIFNDALSQDFEIIINSKPKNLELDPDNWIIKDILNVVAVDDNKLNIPKRLNLYQNYPNPFNPETTITYSIPFLDNKSTSVNLSVFNLLGRKVKTLIHKEQSPGNYKIIFNANNLPSGIYYYRLKLGNFSETKKMILLK